MVFLALSHECRVKFGKTPGRTMPEGRLERAQIEHELEILRARHALIARWDRVARIFVLIALPVCAIALAGALVYAFVVDIVVGIYIIAISAVAAGAVWIGWGKEDAAADRAARANAPPSRFYPLGLALSDVWYWPNEKSEIDTLQDMIALREKRLSELKQPL
jgi:hypothetical protein